MEKKEITEEMVKMTRSSMNILEAEPLKNGIGRKKKKKADFYSHQESRMMVRRIRMW